MCNVITKLIMIATIVLTFSISVIIIDIINSNITLRRILVDTLCAYRKCERPAP